MKAENLSVGAGDKEKNEFVEIGKTISFCVRFPVIGVALENQSLTGDILFEAKRTEAGPFVRWRGRRPELAELSFLVGFFEKMARQDGEAVEESFLDTIGFRELENESLRVDLANGDRLSADDQQIALCGVDIFVEVDAKGEEDVVGIERMAVRETQALAQSERVLKAVSGDFPGFG